MKHAFMILISSALLLCAACTAKKEPRAKPPVPVKVAQALQKDVPVQVKAIGNIEAYTSVALKSQVSGQIARVHFQEGSDVAGITLALDVLSAVAMAAGERARGGRLWGAARALQRASGTGLADWDEQMFSTKSYSARTALEPAERDRLGAQGASLPLADVVAYALGERDPFAAL